MSALVAWGLACGLGLGLGLWCLLGLVPAFGRPRLSARLAPYVLDVSPAAREAVARSAANPAPVLGLLVNPLVLALAGAATSALGGTELTERRLRQAGLAMTVVELRSRQVVWSAASTAIGVLVAVAVARAQSVPAVAAVGIILLFGIGGFVARDYLLQRAAKARLAQMTSELPTVLEFLTLSLSAGEGILDAVRRVSRIGRGELARELSLVMTEVNTGVPLAEGLGRAAAALELAPFSRFVEQLTIALDRGTPLAEVLRAQANDARERSKRDLIEAAGRKEVAMLVPLVFLILPVTIVFAIFPGIMVLQMGF